MSKGVTIGEASKKIGGTEQTHYRWRKPTKEMEKYTKTYLEG